MPNGFVTERPAARYGDGTFNSSATIVHVQKFVCPDSGTQEITEIGQWLSADVGETGYFKMAIFTDDAGNDCPESMVANSLTDELSWDTTTITCVYHTYGTKPQLTGGVTYWIGHIAKDALLNMDRIATDGLGLYKTGTTYPTFPDGDAWHTHTDYEVDHSYYAVYEAAAGGDAHAGGGNIIEVHGAISAIRLPQPVLDI